jgi:hypothetical protein
MRNALFASLLVTVLVSSRALADDEPAWRPLFNGKDLSGWVRVNCAPKTFTVRDKMIVSTGVPTGVLRSDRHYENFELELEWRHMKPKGNAGLFVWSGPIPVKGKPFTKAIEVQILDGRNTPNYTSHGDIFSIQGATMKPDRPHPGGWATRCLPSERRCKPAGQWNHYRVVCKDGAVKLAVNGKVVSGGSECNPRKGYICLEAEGSECHFRNIRIRELPPGKTKPEHTAPLAENFRSLYTGVDLDGWDVPADSKGPWRARDSVLVSNGKGLAKGTHLWTKKKFGDFVMIADWRFPKKASADAPGPSGIRVRGASGPFVAVDRPAGKWNRLVITVSDGKMRVELNGKKVTEGPLPEGVPARGRIGLLALGRPVEMMNLFVRELD